MVKPRLSPYVGLGSPAQPTPAAAATGQLPAAKTQLPAATTQLPAANAQLPAGKTQLPAATAQLSAAKTINFPRGMKQTVHVTVYFGYRLPVWMQSPPCTCAPPKVFREDIFNEDRLSI